MRLFTAISLPKNVKDQVSDVIRGQLPVPYINTSNLHITLNFFGELTGPEVDKVQGIFKNTQSFKKFKVQFESLVKARDQIHITVRKNSELEFLQSTLQKAFEGGGFRFQNRAFYAHVKLTNLHMDKVMHPERTLQVFPQEQIKIIEFEADKVVLYESKLLLHHAKHTPTMEMELK